MFSPSDPLTAVALYLLGRWWTVEDVLKTADPSRDGAVEVGDVFFSLLLANCTEPSIHLKSLYEFSSLLVQTVPSVIFWNRLLIFLLQKSLRSKLCTLQVKTVGERVVLYVLNRVIYRAKEMSADELPFLCHGEKDYAKILWKDGEAVGFYSVKAAGNLSVLNFSIVPLHVEGLGYSTQVTNDSCYSGILSSSFRHLMEFLFHQTLSAPCDGLNLCPKEPTLSGFRPPDAAGLCA